MGLPARGKTHVAHRLARHLNWGGESTKGIITTFYISNGFNEICTHMYYRDGSMYVFFILVFECSEYRRRIMEAYARHDMFRADHPTGADIRMRSARNAVDDAIDWLKDGNSIAVRLFAIYYILELNIYA